LPQENIILRKAGFPELAFFRQGKSSFVEWKGEKPSRVQVQQDTQHLTLYYQASRTQDVRYLKAALESWLDHAGRKYQLEVTGKMPDPTQPADWIGWLSDEPVPKAIGQQMAEGLRLFRDGSSGKSQPLRAQLTVEGWATPLNLYRQDTLRETGQVLWKNNFGEPVLTFSPLGKGGSYHFHSRLHPDWSELPESAFFPQLIGLLLNPVAVRQPDHLDRRLLDESQVRPVKWSRKVDFGWKVRRQTDVRPVAGLLALLLFALERGFVQRKRKTRPFNQPKEMT
jgi:hypothetical protein